MLDARGAVVYRLDPETWELARVATSSGTAGALRADLTLPRGAGIEGVAAATRQPVPTADLLEDPRVVLSPQGQQELRASGWGAALALPLLGFGRVVGELAGASLTQDRLIEACYSTVSAGTAA